MSQDSRMEVNPFDAWIPNEMAKQAEVVGQAKATRDIVSSFMLAILAGAFIAWGAAFATTVTTGGRSLPFGVTKLLGGLAFCLGLVLVIVAGAELFTGNNLIVMAWASRRVTMAQLLSNWLVVYLGNFVGALLTALLIHNTGYSGAADGAVGDNVLQIANAKCRLTTTEAVAAGIGCNALVCLAVWLCFSARSVTDKILAIIFPISAFVATGMEHCVANMYFIPLGLLEKASLDTTSVDLEHLTVGNFLLRNLLPVTCGNVVGGALLVGMVYWCIYLRTRSVEA